MEPMKLDLATPGKIKLLPKPKSVGQQVKLGAGAYTAIVNVYGPSQAGSGETVNLQVVVKNTASYGFYISVTATYDSTSIYATPDYAGVDPGSTYTFNLTFTMPNKDLSLIVRSFFWTGTEWYADDVLVVKISRIWVWIPLASATLSVKRAGVGAWIKLASTSRSVKKAVVGAWVSLDAATISVKKAMIGGWVPLNDFTLTVEVGASAGKDIFKSLAVDFEKKLPKEFSETT